MRWSVFAIFAFVFMVLEVSLRSVLVLQSVGNLAPSFVAVLVVFTALFAPRAPALWAAWLLGLLVDLCIDLPHGAHQVGPLIGPHALGYVFGAFLILQARTMLLRGRVLTVAIATVLCVAATNLVAVFIYAVHGWYPSESLYWADLGATAELLRRLGDALYTGLLALIVARPLMWTIPLWGFRTTGSRSVVWR